MTLRAIRMNGETDLADNEIHGLARYLPTALAKSLLVATFGVPIAAFQVVRGNVDWFLLQGRTPLEQTLIAVTVSLCVSIVFSLALAVELAHVISTKKHRRIVHYSNAHPCMSRRWLATKTSVIHWLVVFILLALVVTLGFYAAG